MVEFDAAAHTYRADGRRLPSVTGVLRRAGHLDDLTWFGSPAAKARGRLVHTLTAVLDAADCTALGATLPVPKGLLAPPPELLVLDAAGRLSVAIPDDLRPYLDAYRRFRVIYGPRWDVVERPMARLDLGYAGTPDRVGTLNGQPAVVEIKTGGPAEWHGYQLAGYDLLDPLPFARRRVGVYLRPDGKFRVRRYDDQEDRYHFLRALAQAREDT
jgi:hypothetical protein